MKTKKSVLEYKLIEIRLINKIDYILKEPIDSNDKLRLIKCYIEEWREGELKNEP